MPPEMMKTRVMNFINRTFSTVYSRVVVVLGLCVFLLMALFLIPRLLLIAVLMFFLFSLINYFRYREWIDRRSFLRFAVASARRFRQIFSVSKDVEFLNAVVLMVAFVWLIFLALQEFPEPVQWEWGLKVMVAFLIFSGFIDAVRITKEISRLAWARLTGKVFYTCVAAFSIWVGGVVSARLIAQATGVNPEVFIATGRLIQGVISILVGLGVVVSLLSLVSMLIHIFIMGWALLAQPYVIVMSIFKPREEKSSVFYRLVHGKKKLQGVPERWVKWESMIGCVRPVGVLTAGMCVLLLLGNLQNTLDKKFGPIIQEMVVQVEFYAGQRCADWLINQPSKLVGAEEIIIASKVGDDWQFESFMCEKRLAAV